jgi:hypothetical protein
MKNHAKKIIVTACAVAALGVGGATLAQAGATQVKSTTTTAASESSSGPDTDTVQSGDQTTPDNSQSGDPADPSGETSGSEISGNDGPGGHADEPGNSNADHQFNGQE